MKKELGQIKGWKHFNPFKHQAVLGDLTDVPLTKYKDVLQVYKQLFREWLRQGESAKDFINEFGYLLKPGGFVEDNFFPDDKYLEELAAAGKLKDQGLIDITRRDTQHSREFFNSLMTPENTGKGRNIEGEMAKLGKEPFYKDIQIDWRSGKFGNKLFSKEEIHHVDGVMELSPWFADLSDEGAFELRQEMFRDGYDIGSVKSNRIALEELQHINPYPREILDYFSIVDPDGYAKGKYAGTGIHEIMGEHGITTKQGGTLLSSDLQTYLKKADVKERAKLLKTWLDLTEEAKISSAMEAFGDPHNFPGGKPTKAALKQLKDILGTPGKDKKFAKANMAAADEWMRNRGYLDTAKTRAAKYQKGINTVGAGLDQALGGGTMQFATAGGPTLSKAAALTADTSSTARALGAAENFLVTSNPEGAAALADFSKAGTTVGRRVAAIMPFVGVAGDVWDLTERHKAAMDKSNDGLSQRLDELQYGIAGATVGTTWWAEPANMALGLTNLGIDVGRTLLEEDKRTAAGNTLRALGTAGLRGVRDLSKSLL
tara:strand:- start:750 stop:2381 length:1632 start_codon:yes stop_codon:yes gene_type:complete